MTNPTAIVLFFSLLLPGAARSDLFRPSPDPSGLQRGSLAEMRASGVLPVASSLSIEERESLAAADAAAGDLVGLRGGEISNSTLWTILLVLGIIALVIIIV